MSSSATSSVWSARKTASVAAYLTIGLLVFFAVASVVGRILGANGVDDQDFVLVRTELASKWPKTDVLFVGTSRLLHGANTDVFDATMAELGKPKHSFN